MHFPYTQTNQVKGNSTWPWVCLAPEEKRVLLSVTQREGAFQGYECPLQSKVSSQQNVPVATFLPWWVSPSFSRTIPRTCFVTKRMKIPGISCSPNFHSCGDSLNLMPSLKANQEICGGWGQEEAIIMFFSSLNFRRNTPAQRLQIGLSAETR